MRLPTPNILGQGAQFSVAIIIRNVIRQCALLSNINAEDASWKKSGTPPLQRSWRVIVVVRGG
jgi:hypothetical protein